MDYIIKVYRNYAVFDGRARRTEYWAFAGFCVAVLLVATLLMEMGSALELVGGGLLGVFLLGSVIPSLAVRVRRLHDIDRSGFWIFLALLPAIGSLVLLVLSLLPGTRGPNRFGSDPKGADGAAAEVFA